MQLRVRTAVAALSVALTVTATSGPSSHAAAKPATEPKARFATELRYTFDLGETLRPGSLIRDASGNRHPGRVVAAEKGHLKVVRGIRGRGAAFPISHCSDCRKVMIEARDRTGLNPGKHAFMFGTAVRVTSAQARGDSNLLQKGLHRQAGGQYKLQLNDDGFPSCVVRGSLGRLIINAKASVADGEWHRLDCTRTARSITLRVDGRVRGRAHGRTGKVANDGSLKIGGRTVKAHNDQYHGILDNAFLRVRR